MQASLSLRPLGRSDLPWFVEVRNSARQFLHDSREFSVEDAEVWFDRPRPEYQVIELAGEPAGYFRLERSPTESGVLQVGADLSPHLRGQGMGERIYREFLPRLLDAYDVLEFSLRVLPTNGRAIRLYRRLGFTTHALSTRAGTARSIEVVDIEMRLAPDALERSLHDLPPDVVDLLVADVRPANESS